MGVEKHRHTKSRRNKRRGNIFIRPSKLAKCPKCGKALLPHVVCPNCGEYKGVSVIDVMKKLTKKEQKLKQREMAAKEQEKEKSLAWEGEDKK